MDQEKNKIHSELDDVDFTNNTILNNNIKDRLGNTILIIIIYLIFINL